MITYFKIFYYLITHICIFTKYKGLLTNNLRFSRITVHRDWREDCEAYLSPPSMFIEQAFARHIVSPIISSFTHPTWYVSLNPLYLWFNFFFSLKMHFSSHKFVIIFWKLHKTIFYIIYYKYIIKIYFREYILNYLFYIFILFTFLLYIVRKYYIIISRFY